MIKDALWIPIRDIKDVVKIFWPVIFLILLPYLLPLLPENLYVIENFSADKILSNPIVIWPFLIVFFFITGLAKWHRKLVLGQNVSFLNILPRPGDIKFFLYTFLFAVIYALIAGLILMAIGAAARYLFPELLNTNAREVLLFVVGTIAIFITTLLFVILFLDTIFVLPRSAVEKGWYYLDSKVKEEAIADSGWPNQFLAIFLLTNFLGLLDFVVPAFIPPFILALYGSLVFSTALSIFYRDRFRPILIKANEEYATEFSQK